MLDITQALGLYCSHDDKEGEMKNLEDLRDAMVSDDPSVIDHDGQWLGNLPTFGGVEPTDTYEVWSWDETRLLVGTCADDLKIVNR